MSCQQKLGQLGAQERLFVQELPIDGPLVLKDTGKLERLAEVTLGVGQREGQ